VTLTINIETGRGAQKMLKKAGSGESASSVLGTLKGKASGRVKIGGGGSNHRGKNAHAKSATETAEPSLEVPRLTKKENARERKTCIASER